MFISIFRTSRYPILFTDGRILENYFCAVYLRYLMKRETTIFFLGLLVASMPFWGVPNAWKRGISLALGLLLMFLGYQLRRLAYLRSIESHTGERKTDVYIEQVGARTDTAPPPVASTEGEPTLSRLRRQRTKKS